MRFPLSVHLPDPFQGPLPSLGAFVPIALPAHVHSLHIGRGQGRHPAEGHVHIDLNHGDLSQCSVIAGPGVWRLFQHGCRYKTEVITPEGRVVDVPPCEALGSRSAQLLSGVGLLPGLYGIRVDGVEFQIELPELEKDSEVPLALIPPRHLPETARTNPRRSFSEMIRHYYANYQKRHPKLPKLPPINPQNESRISINVYTFEHGNKIQRTPAITGQFVLAWEPKIGFRAVRGGGLRFEGGRHTDGYVRRTTESIPIAQAGNLIVTTGDIIEIGHGQPYRIRIGCESLRRKEVNVRGEGRSWRHNVRMLYSDNFNQMRRSESNGNVGADYIGINGAVSRQGFLLLCANEQNWPEAFCNFPKIKIRLHQYLNMVEEVVVEGPGLSSSFVKKLKDLEGINLSLPMEWYLTSRVT